ncbi:MAG: GAF domain-containing protein [Candidatus Rokubacteria bacterium]|nr:GAF domain-containing protein [Candidatus Rokubacteria bacterium]
MSLRATFVGVALVTVVPFVALVAYFGSAQISREKARVQEDALGQARALATQLEAYLTARLDALVAAAGAVAASAGDVSALEAQARRYRQTFPDFEQVLVLDPVGTVVAAAAQLPEGRRLVFGDQEWFKRAATSLQALVGEPRQVRQDIVVGYYAPARASDGQFRGLVAGDLTLRRVQEMLAGARLRPGGVVEVVSERGLVVARHPAGSLMQDARALSGYADLLQRPEAVGEIAFEDGERRLAGAVQLRPFGWTVAVGLPSSQLLADVRTVLVQVGGGVVVVTLLSLGVALWIAGRTATGMERLRAAMSRLETGSIPTSVPVTVGGEVGALTEGFNRLLGWLRNKLREYEALSQVEEAAGAAIGRESVASVLPELLRKVVGGMAADAGVLLIQEDGDLVTKAAVGFAGALSGGVTLRRGQGLAGAVVGSREAMVIEDVEGDYRVEEPYLKTAGLRSVIGVPIVSGDQVLGAVEVAYRVLHTFTDAEIQRLEAMARRTAQALEHERALEDVRRNTVGLEAKLAEQMEALQKAAMEQAEARRQAQEARQKTQELEQTIRMQVPTVKEVVREKEVVRADPAAEEAKRVRVALQKTVSEELRVPLTALLDLPRFLLDGINKPLSHEEQQQLEVLHTRGQEILELIDDLVTLSALHGDQAKAAKAPFNLPELVQRVVRSLQPRAAAKGNRIQADIKSDVGQLVSDAKRVEQILANLLLTSAKYTELGEIRVTCFLRGPEVVLAVADDGQGFSTEEQARIFEPFLQVSPRDGRKLPGTGLLLTVCQRLVQLLGGKIRVESEIDRGTWFTVTLPLQS